VTRPASPPSCCMAKCHQADRPSPAPRDPVPNASERPSGRPPASPDSAQHPAASALRTAPRKAPGEPPHVAAGSPDTRQTCFFAGATIFVRTPPPCPDLSRRFRGYASVLPHPKWPARRSRQRTGMASDGPHPDIDCVSRTRGGGAQEPIRGAAGAACRPGRADRTLCPMMARTLSRSPDAGSASVSPSPRGVMATGVSGATGRRVVGCQTVCSAVRKAMAARSSAMPWPLAAEVRRTPGKAAARRTMRRSVSAGRFAGIDLSAFVSTT